VGFAGSRAGVEGDGTEGAMGFTRAAGGFEGAVAGVVGRGAQAAKKVSASAASASWGKRSVGKSMAFWTW
jgi:hypothetical protein